MITLQTKDNHRGTETQSGAKKFKFCIGLIVLLVGSALAGCSKEAEAAKLTETETPHLKKDAAGVVYCGEHNVPETECAICHPDAVATLNPGQGIKLRLAGKESATLGGVTMGVAKTGVLSQKVECYAEMAFNQNKVAQMIAPISGVLQEVTVELGGMVREKQTVARIWSSAIAEAAAKTVLARQTLDRERTMRAERVTSEKDVQQAEAAYRAASQQIKSLGFSEEQIATLDNKSLDSILLEVQAPFAGEIVDRTAVQGSLTEAGKLLFTLADRSTMWAMLNIPESDLGKVRVGQTVELHVDSLPMFAGKLTWISSELDERTRMARARAEISNPEGLLRARMFAHAKILTRTIGDALLLPVEAVQWVEGKPLVFVKVEDDLFEVRAVRVGTKNDGQWEILEGLKAEENVVTGHAFAIKSQLLLSKLGAGCADD